MREPRDEFLSAEDLDPGGLSWEERLAWWNYWLLLAQATNDRDADLYSHGVFAGHHLLDPPWRAPVGAGPSPSSRPQREAVARRRLQT